jgi:hypothetical protein
MSREAAHSHGNCDRGRSGDGLLELPHRWHVGVARQVAPQAASILVSSVAAVARAPLTVSVSGAAAWSGLPACADARTIWYVGTIQMRGGERPLQVGGRAVRRARAGAVTGPRSRSWPPGRQSVPAPRAST